ncbi:hypothetical protein [Sphingomonas prati]|uniref:Uncharacterized protein n=1 Tax=Sphingomonas prati TaxID=1843237 RepID=A0A7W9BQC2_9SPHN|nr:hypothetical protein [Sphingomonas prati]MBB5728188.1 hypothetical protein [Sphingomonas prati]GGE75702.1 hypothetical protein GCM10011404_05410 [Sphingomonas prati]
MIAGGFVPAVLMIAVIALTIGGFALRGRGERQRSTLMFVAAAVFLGNVLIQTWPR